MEEKTMKYKGDLEEFPQEVVEWMCDQQEAQGNKRDVSVFERCKRAIKSKGGVCFGETKEGYNFCSEVIENLNFNLFFKHFPKEENINDILEECKIKEEQDYPKVMWCWDDDVSNFDELVVIGKFKDSFMCIEKYNLDEFETGYSTLESFGEDIYFFQNASLTKPVKEYTREQAEKEFNINIID